MELDRLIELLAARRSSQARLRSDEPLQLWSDAGWVSANSPLAGAQLNRMLAVAAPPQVRAVVHDLNARYEFDFSHSSGIYRVSVEAIAGRRTVFVTRLGTDGAPLRGVDDGSGAFGLHDSPAQNSVAPQPDGFEPFPVPSALRPTESHRPAPPRTPAFDPVSSNSSSSPQPESAPEWFYAHANQTMGPHTFEQMVSLVKSGALPRETMVFSSRVGDWQQAKLSELGRFYVPDTAGEWVAPSVQNWQPPSEADIRSEKIFVRSVVGGGVGLVVLLVAWTALSQVRGSNRAFDYSPQMARRVENQSATTTTGTLHNVHLQRSDNDPMTYFGTGQYSNNYLADVALSVEKRDFWSRPEESDFKITPHDFTGELESLIQSRINTRLAAARVESRVERVSLVHGTGNTYSGTITFDDSTYPLSAEIQEFDTDGTLLRWTHHVDFG